MKLLKKNEKIILHHFFIWCVKKAKIDVLDAERSIELKGYGESFHPIMTLDEMINLYANEYARDID